MTAEEYREQEAAEFDLKNIPQEFRSAISYHAYEEGHAYGWSEVLIHLRDLIDGLEPAIRAFEKRVRTEAYERKQQ